MILSFPLHLQDTERVSFSCSNPFQNHFRHNVNMSFDYSRKLFDSIACKDSKSVESLLPLFENVNFYSKTSLHGHSFDWAPIHAAALCGDLNIIEILIQYGADVELPDRWYGGRPLAWAAFSGHKNICVKLIQSYGAYPFAKNAKGQSALDIAANPEDPEWKNIFNIKQMAKNTRKRLIYDSDEELVDVESHNPRLRIRVKPPTPKIILRVPIENSLKIKLHINPEEPASKKFMNFDSHTTSLKEQNNYESEFREIKEIKNQKSELNDDFYVPGILMATVKDRPKRSTRRTSYKINADREDDDDDSDKMDDELEERKEKGKGKDNSNGNTNTSTPKPVSKYKQSFLASIGIVTNNTHMRLILPTTEMRNYTLTLPQGVTSLNIRILYSQRPTASETIFYTSVMRHNLRRLFPLEENMDFQFRNHDDFVIEMKPGSHVLEFSVMRVEADECRDLGVEKLEVRERPLGAGDSERRKAKANQPDTENTDSSKNKPTKKAAPRVINRRKLLRQKNVPPAVPKNGLSIVEQIFLKSPPERPQVILGGALRVEIPVAVKRFNVPRIVDLLKIMAAAHPRLSSHVDPQSQVTVSLGETAEDLNINYRVVERTGPENLEKAFREEINTNFILDDRRFSLWRVVLIVPPGTPREDKENLLRMVEEPLEENPEENSDLIEISRKANSDIDDWDKPPSAEALAAAVSVIDDSMAPRRSSIRRRSLKFMSRTPTWINHNKKKSGSIQMDSNSAFEGGIEENTFDIIFTFHHSLGDGLCLYTFIKSMFAQFSAEQFNAPSLNLIDFPVAKDDVPLLDNLVNPSFLEVLPAAIGMLNDNYIKGRREKFKGRTNPTLQKFEDENDPQKIEQKPELKTDNTEHQLLLGANSVPSYSSFLTTTKSDDEIKPENQIIIENGYLSPTGEKKQPDSIHSHTTSILRSPSPTPIYNGDIIYGFRSVFSNTKTRFLSFDAEYVTTLRKRCKAEGTTIAGAIVVAALAAMRTSFAEDYKHKSMPTHQGWVVTNSARHLLPQSRLLEGGDKQSDPSVDVFGGYAGSVSSTLKLVDNQDFWERSRVVRRKIAQAFVVSLQRMKLANYCYRRPTLYKWIEKNANLESRSRSYSIELANLGAWDYPYGCAQAGVPPTATDANWMRLQNFWGAVNSSFDGVRGLFTIGVVTLGGNMSVAVGYDTRAVNEADADLFVNAMTNSLRKAAESTGKLQIGFARTLKSNEETVELISTQEEDKELKPR
ncbi:hypothetical protein HK096_005879 [Nowakowskiella sp. JEL0078]|nr:hypothetical protein HK096_005879 [Nowakowskiella sp. JEL0078]